jgi:hypothetical protein
MGTVYVHFGKRERPLVSQFGNPLIGWPVTVGASVSRESRIGLSQD